MSLLDRLAQEMKAAMLARDQDRLSALRMLKSAIGYAQIERKNEALPDSELISIVQKEVKKRRDSISQFEQAGRAELVAKEQAELSVLEAFLPQPLTAAELDSLVRETIAELAATSKKEMGAVIKAVQAKAAGRADGKTVSSLVSQLLP